MPINVVVNNTLRNTLDKLNTSYFLHTTRPETAIDSQLMEEFKDAIAEYSRLPLNDALRTNPEYIESEINYNHLVIMGTLQETPTKDDVVILIKELIRTADDISRKKKRSMDEPQSERFRQRLEQYKAAADNLGIFLENREVRINYWKIVAKVKDALIVVESHYSRNINSGLEQKII